MVTAALSTRYFSGQGKVYLSPKDPTTGEPTSFAFLGNTPDLVLNPGRAADRYATGGSEAVGDLVKGTGAPEAIFVIDELTKANLAKALYSVPTSVAGAAVSNEVVVAKLGASVPLANINVTTWTSLRNSALSTTYVEGTDYTINRNTGLLTFPASGSAITDAQSLRATYTFTTHDKIGAFTTATAYYWLRFDGINTVDPNWPPVVLDIYKVKLLPTQALALLSDSISMMQLIAKIYYDSTRSGADGFFFRLRQV